MLTKRIIPCLDVKAGRGRFKSGGTIFTIKRCDNLSLSPRSEGD